MKRFSCVAAAALFAVACSASDNTSIPAPTSNPDPNNPSNPTNPTKPTDPAKPSDPVKPVDLTPATKADCDALASAFCQRLTACDSFAATLFGTVAACTTRYSDVCLAGATAPGSGTTHAALAACTPVVATTSCDSILGSDGPAPCTFKGTLADASKCAFKAQCASGSCSGHDGACGVCEHVAAIGDTCTGSTKCATGAFCNTSTGKCAARKALGQSCATGSDECVTKGSCVGGSCTAFAKTGQPCDKSGVTAPLCDLANGYACVGAPATCTKFPITTTLGATCGFDVSSLTLCGGGLACAYAGSTGSGTCVPETPEGGACTPGPGGGSSTCALALECIAGKCSYTTAAVCK